MDVQIHSGIIDISPSEAGFHTDALQRLDQLLLSLVKNRRLLSASYLLSREGKTFAHRSFGELHYTGNGKPLMPDSIRRIASITKMFTVVCILRLMEEGKLYLKQPVKDFIKEFDHHIYEKIQIVHLITHTSGLHPDPGYYAEPYPAGWWDYEFAFHHYDDQGNVVQAESAEEAGAMQRSRWIKAILAGPPVCEPGESWNYSSAGYSFLGEIIHRVTGMSCEQYMKRHIFDPLGLKHTFFRVPDELKSEVCIVNEWEHSRLEDDQDRTYMAPRTGGGLYSTLSDLNRMGLMLLGQGTFNGQRILSRKSVQLMASDQFKSGIPAFHWGENHKQFHTGLGVSIGQVYEPYKDTVFFHEGAGRSMLMIDRQERLVVSVLVPSLEDWVPESITGVKNIIWSGLQ